MDKNHNVCYMNCPIHENIIMYSIGSISFDFPVRFQRKSAKLMKIPVNSQLYYCNKCDEFYISDNRVRENASVFLNGLYGGLYITNAHTKQRVVNSTKSKIVNGNIDIYLIMDEIRHLLKIKYAVFGYNKDICKYDNVKLVRTDDIELQINNRQKKCKSNSASTECFTCPKCNRVYFNKNIVSPLVYHLKTMDDIIAIIKNPPSGQRGTRIPFPKISDVVAKENAKVIHKLLEDTDFTYEDIKIQKKIPKKCVDGAILQSYDKLITYNLDNQIRNIRGSYCPKCQSLYFSDTNNLIEIKKDVFKKKYSGVRVRGFDEYYKNVITLHPDKLYRNGVTYRQAYEGRDISKTIVIRSVLNNFNNNALDELIQKYGYNSVDKLGNCIECESFNEKIKRIFKKDSFEELFYSNEEFYKDVIKFISENEVKPVMAERIVDDNGESKYINIIISYVLQKKSCDIVFSVLVKEFSSGKHINEIVKNIDKSRIEFKYSDYVTCRYDLDKNTELYNALLSINNDNVTSMIKRISKEKVYNLHNKLVKELTDGKCMIVNNSDNEESKIIKILAADFLFECNSIEHRAGMKSYSTIYAISKDRRIRFGFIDHNNQIYLKCLKKENDDQIKERILNAADFLVRTTNYQCTNRNHNLVRINAIVRVMKQDEIMEIETPAYFCSICNRYYILDRDYEQLKRYGYICCRVDTYESLINSNDSIYGKLKEQSILMNYGYSVDKNRGLSEKQRHDILAFMIDNNVIKKNKIVDHLTWLINFNKNRPHREEAIRKWKNDIKFVQNHEKVQANVYAKSIKTPIRRIRLEHK